MATACALSILSLSLFGFRAHFKREMKCLKIGPFFLGIIILLFISCFILGMNFCFSSSTSSSLRTLSFDGHLEFNKVDNAMKDFGNRYSYKPKAVLHPKSVADIATTLKHIWQIGPQSELTVAARGHGHSLQGQSQAHQGVVISMETLRFPPMEVHMGNSPYVDVSGGELWIHILHETLKYGLAPKSWTDYLHLTVGGTLSNAGISGQAFNHGPQISNVYQLEVVTGKGEVLSCSEEQNTILFRSVLGGLGQFGIITRAKIVLEPAPEMVKWIRVLYTDFKTFCKDQEHLISAANTFDYIEGFVIINKSGLLNSWRSSFNPQDPVQASQFQSDGRTLYCLEVAKYFNLAKDKIEEKEIQRLLSQLSYIPSTLFLSEVSYADFLDRVHASEVELRSKGLWEVPHPWLNLLIPKSKIQKFAEGVFGNILTETSNGPILIYPIHKSKWDNRTSAVIPNETIFYLVAFLASAVPTSAGTASLDYILTQNRRIIDFCEQAKLGMKQYLPHYTTREEWRTHFGSQWEEFVQRKSTYDPLAILAPGHRIFQKGDALTHSSSLQA